MSSSRSVFSRGVVISSLVTIAFVVLLFIIGGFDADEFRVLIRFLIPIKSAYLIAAFKHFSERSKNKQEGKSQSELSPRYRSAAKWVLYGHLLLFIVISFLITINRIDFDFYMDMLAILETLLGGTIGFLISDILGTKKED